MHILRSFTARFFLISIVFSSLFNLQAAAAHLDTPLKAQPILSQGSVPAALSTAQTPTLGIHMVFVPTITNGNPVYTSVTIPAGGGNASFAGGKITITVPGGAASGAITLKVTTPSLQAPSGLYAFGSAIDIQASDSSGAPITQFNQPITLTFYYDQLSFLIWPSMRIYTQNTGGAWSYVPTEYVSGQKAAKASVTHFSTYALFGASAPYNYQRMAGDSTGNVYLVSSDGRYIYRMAPGDTDPTLYGDLTSVIGYGSSYGDLARDPLSGDLYIGNASTVYRLTPGKQLSTFYTLPLNGDAVRGLHVSQSFGALFISALYGTYQVDLTTGVKGTIWEGSGSNQVATDSNKRIFVSYDYWSAATGTGSMLAFWPDIVNQPGTHYALEGFLGTKRIAIDGDDNIYVPNPDGNAISVVGGPDGVVTGFIRNIQSPTNIAVAGSNLVVATAGGLQVISASRRDPATATPIILEKSTISGKGSLVQIFGGDPIPANNTLRINGKVQRNLADYSAMAHTVVFDLDQSTIMPPWSTPLQGYNASLYQAQVFDGSTLVLDVQLQVPEPGNFTYLDFSSETYINRGGWGIFSNSDWVVSTEGLFPEWNIINNGGSLAYQFNQTGTFHFTVLQYSSSTQMTLTVHVSAGGNPADPGDCQSTGGGTIDPIAGTIYRASGASLEIPPAALPGTAPYTLESYICNKSYPGKDSVTAESWGYQFKFTPEPTSLLRDITIRLPYDPAQAATPAAGFYDPAISDLDLLPFSVSNGSVVITLAAGNYSSPASATAGSSPRQSAAILGKLNTILGGLWWAVGLPNAQVSNDHFLIYFNTGDCTMAYAQGLLDDLQTAYDKYSADGYPLPTLPVLVKIATWISATTRPGVTIGTLGIYHLFINNALTPTDRADTAAHEFFHVVQRVSINPADFVTTPTWWLEGTATWAQYLVHPSSTGYLTAISGVLNFPNTPFSQWSSLSPEEQYATMALAQYLVYKKGSTAIREVNLNLNAGMSMKDALQTVAGESWSSFYAEWAKDYWMQTYAPVNTWNLDSAATIVNPTQASTWLLNNSILALSSGLIKAYFNPSTPNPPPSFNNGVDSVVRMLASCTSSEIYLFDKSKALMGSFIGSVPVDQGIRLLKIGTYVLNNPIYMLYINAGSGYCFAQVLWEAPTITSVSPGTVTVNTVTAIGISGDGFGSNTGSVIAGGITYTPTSWTSTIVTFNLPSGSTPGTIHIQVQLPGGAMSNPVTITITS